VRQRDPCVAGALHCVRQAAFDGFRLGKGHFGVVLVMGDGHVTDTRLSGAMVGCSTCQSLGNSPQHPDVATSGGATRPRGGRSPCVGRPSTPETRPLSKSDLRIQPLTMSPDSRRTRRTPATHSQRPLPPAESPKTPPHAAEVGLLSPRWRP